MLLVVSYLKYHSQCFMKIRKVQYNSHEYSYLYREKLSTCYTIRQRGKSNKLRLFSHRNVTQSIYFPAILGHLESQLCSCCPSLVESPQIV